MIDVKKIRNYSLLVIPRLDRGIHNALCALARKARLDSGLRRNDKRVVTRILPLLIFVVIVIFLWKGLSKNPQVIPSVLINKPVPEFKAPGLADQSEIITNKLFLGHVSLLNVWATWCTTCQAEHSQLMRIAKLRLVNLYGLNYKDDRTKAMHWLYHEGNPFQEVIYDPRGNLAINLGVYGTPETFVIGKHGIIRDKIIGGISPELWQTKLLPEIQKLREES